MKTSTKVILGVAGSLVVVGGILFASYVSAYNLGNAKETSIPANYENLQNILSQYGNKVAEVAQVPSMKRDDAVAVIKASMEGKFGKDGSQATFQWFKDHEIPVSDTLYAKIQQIMEAGRNEFQNAQTSFIDLKRSYQKDLGTFWTGTWLNVAGYPQINVGYPRGTQDDYPIVKSQNAINTFATGIDAPINLR